MSSEITSGLGIKGGLRPGDVSSASGRAVFRPGGRFLADDDERHVVLLFLLERLDVREDALEGLLHGQGGVAAERIRQPGLTEHLAPLVPALGRAVGKEEDRVAGGEAQVLHLQVGADVVRDAEPGALRLDDRDPLFRRPVDEQVLVMAGDGDRIVPQAEEHDRQVMVRAEPQCPRATRRSSGSGCP